MYIGLGTVVVIIVIVVIVLMLAAAEPCPSCRTISHDHSPPWNPFPGYLGRHGRDSVHIGLSSASSPNAGPTRCRNSTTSWSAGPVTRMPATGPPILTRGRCAGAGCGAIEGTGYSQPAWYTSRSVPNGFSCGGALGPLVDDAADVPVGPGQETFRSEKYCRSTEHCRLGQVSHRSRQAGRRHRRHPPPGRRHRYGHTGRCAARAAAPATTANMPVLSPGSRHDPRVTRFARLMRTDRVDRAFLDIADARHEGRFGACGGRKVPVGTGGAIPGKRGRKSPEYHMARRVIRPFEKGNLYGFVDSYHSSSP